MTSLRTAIARRRRRSEPRAERGATLAGYALIFSAMTVLSLGAIEALNQTSGEYLDETGNQIGEARPSRFENNAASGSGGGSGGGGGSTPIPPTPPAAAFPGGDNPDPNISPLPSVVSGEAIFPIPSGLPDAADLDGNSGWDDDDYSFIFVEGMWTQSSDETISAHSNWGGDFDLEAGKTYCSYMYHFSPTTNESNNPTTTVDFGYTIVGVAGSKAAMQATDDEAFLNGGHYGNSSAYNNKLENSDIVSYSGSEATFEMYAVQNGADNARIITECAVPSAGTPVAVDVPISATSSSSDCFEVNGSGVVVQTSTCTGDPSQTFSAYEMGGYVEFRTAGGCLGTDGNGTGNGTLVVEVPCGSISAKWDIGGASPYEVTNQNSSTCLDVNGGGSGSQNIIIYGCHGGSNQQFSF